MVDVCVHKLKLVVCIGRSVHTTTPKTTPKIGGNRSLRVFGSIKRLVFELLAAKRGLDHQPGSRQGEDHNATPVIGVQRRTLCHGDRTELRAHFKMTFLKVCERLGGLKENHFIEGLSTDLGPNIYLSQCGLPNRLALLIHDALSVFASENKTTFNNAGEYGEPGRT